MEGSKVNQETMQRIWKLIQPYRSAFVMCAVLAVIIAPLSAAMPYLINEMTNQFVAHPQDNHLDTYALIYVGVLILAVVCQYLFIYRSNILGQDLIRDLRVQIFHHLNGLHLQYFDKTPVGQSTTRIINDTETINAMVSQGLIPMIADVFAIVAVIVAMLMTSVKLTFISLGVLPLLIYASRLFTRKVRIAYQKLRNELAKMNAFLQERITGMQIIQIFNAEKQELEKFKKINRAYTDENIKNIFYYAVFLPVVDVLSALALGIMVWWGARDVLSDQITLGAMVAFPLFLSAMFRPIRTLADKFNYLQLGIVATERVFKALKIENIIANEGTQCPDRLKGQIRFDRVEFSYTQDEKVLKGVSFEIAPGESMAIVGSTGSGKTTIINLLGRLYEIQSGNILIDGLPIASYDLSNLRSHMAVVLQDVFLFDGSIFDNIRLMNADISDEEIIHASKIIGAHKFFEDLPNGYHFRVTERGGNLSMGQRQLISFVRALVFDPDILILDEATSSVDVETEAVIQHAIEKLITKRTSIIIAHRLSTIINADHILVLNKGRVAQIGRHEELIQDEEGIYYELQKMQLEEDVKM